MSEFSRRRALAALLATALSMAAPFASAQAPARKDIGFGLQVSADGIFNLKVTKAVVTSVQTGSQAEAAGLSVGDELIRVDGVRVPGAKASDLKPHMEFEVGKAKRLVLRRPDGTQYEATFTKE